MHLELLEPYALLPSAAPIVIESIRREVNGESAKEKALIAEPYLIDGDCRPHGLEAAAGENAQSGMIAVVPLMGALSPDGRYGGTSLNSFARIVRQLDANPNISSIVLLVTSPGGTVTGTPEAADAVRAVRDGGNTQIVTIAEGMMASAATWIGTAASEVILTPSGEAGSIGVISIYADTSKLYESMGVKIDVIRNPEKKARFTGFEPLTDEMRQTIETRNLSAYDKFKRAMADNRKIRVDQVEGKFGGGEMLSSADALESGLVDRIATFDVTIARLMKKRAPANSKSRLMDAMK